MITYTSKDIIDRAREISDLEDSSFISWKENLALLNEAYSAFYQKVIDKDEGYFIKEMELTSGKNALPDDFYQIKYVAIKDGIGNIPVHRKTKTESKYSNSYELYNNTIVLNGFNNATLTYYCVPPTLTFPNETYLLSNDNVICAYKNYYVVKGTDIECIDANTNDKIFSISGEETIKQCKAFKNGVFIQCEDANYFMNYKGDNELLDKENYKLYFVNNKCEIEDDTEAFDDCIHFDEYYFTNGTIVKDNTLLYSNVTDFNIIDDRILVCYDGKVDELEGEEYYSNDDYEVVYLNSLNLNTGYGFTAINERGQYCIISPIEDTELNFSNTFFFPVIAYSLAKNYKIKQDADFSKIENRYQEILLQFFDSLSMDSNMPVRIANVY